MLLYYMLMIYCWICTKIQFSYADDTVVISGDDTWASAQEKMNKFLDKLANWF